MADRLEGKNIPTGPGRDSMDDVPMRDTLTQDSGTTDVVVGETPADVDLALGTVC